MPVIVTLDGRQYAGHDAAAAVDAMQAAGLFVRDLSREDYMRGMAERLARLDAINVRSDTPENFLADLAAAGVIRLGEVH